MVYAVIYQEDNTLVRPVVFTDRAKAEAFAESVRNKYIQNVSQKFGRTVPDSFRDHLKLQVIELEIDKEVDSL